MARLAIHIDGAYAGKLAENEFRTWFDYEKLSGKIKSTIASQTQEPLDLVRTYFYDCLPYQSDPPTSDEARRFGNRRKFFHALTQLANYSVREGRLEYRGVDGAGKPIFQQKRTDLMIGLDMALLAAKHQVTHLALFSGDSDLLARSRSRQARRCGGVACAWSGAHLRQRLVDGSRQPNDRGPRIRQRSCQTSGASVIHRSWRSS